MIDKKKLLASIMFGNSKYLIPFIYNRSPIKNLSLLAYHRVVHDLDLKYPFDDGLISCTAEQFDKQMKFVGNHFRVVSFRFLNELVMAGKRIPDKLLIITFDDGYFDNYDVALPILRKHGITATFFITTWNVDTGKIFWFDKVIYQVKKSTCKQFNLLSGRYIIDIKDNNRSKISSELLNILKSIPEDMRIRALQEIDSQSCVTIDEKDIPFAQPLTWEQVKKMDESGMEIGSHTVTHPILSNMSEDRITFELEESKNILEKKLGKDVIAISYPVGENKHYDGRVMEIAKKCGYKFGVSYTHGVSEYQEDRRFNIPRIRVEMNVSFSLFKANLIAPGIFVK